MSKETPDEFHRRLIRERRERNQSDKKHEFLLSFFFAMCISIPFGLYITYPFLIDRLSGYFWTFIRYSDGSYSWNVYDQFSLDLAHMLPLISIIITAIPVLVIFGYWWRNLWNSDYFEKLQGNLKL